MKNILDNLTKDDLIKVIANMHDAIQEWDNGWGLPKDEADTLIKVGRACCTECSKNNDFTLPVLKQ